MYDPECGALAEHFLPDADISDTARLANHIQSTIEDWLNDRELYQAALTPEQRRDHAMADDDYERHRDEEDAR